ncbi:BadF/BadG/BcrA/BcrD ATPase family protein [Devosia albogilva]|uniref:BadF/BadG/BcrA/BcrD ATPase family protein n=1 Tax=Devosia albogilva TaxID=429726 RepID=A0ABW5QNX7_9HYPH
MTAEIHLGLDVGGTASRWTACAPDGTVLRTGSGSGASGHVFNPAEKLKFAKVLENIATELASANLKPVSLTAGLTGYGTPAAADLRHLAAETLRLDAASILFTDDISLAYLANFAPGEGHLVSAGTGSIGLHWSESALIRVGGRGILIDDAGSGSWIALRALDRIYRCLDHTGSFVDVEPLARHLLDAIGGADWQDVRSFVYAGDRGRIGTLATAVARAAAEGHAAAIAILEQAGTELALLAKALAARVGERPVGFIGGVLRLHPAILASIRASLGPELRLLEADASLAAARLQTRAGGGWRQILGA